MGQLKESLVPFITSNEIEEIISTMASQINSDYEGKELVLICPLRGSFLFLADLCRKLKIPQQIDFVHVISSASGPQIIKDISTNISGAHVLIVEEVIDVGKTLNFLRNRLFASTPESLRIATLIDKPSRREAPVKPDYIGRTIDDRYIVGYGMDSEELGRNYSDIYFLKN